MQESSPPRCTGHRKDGSPCRGWRVADTDKCRMHLGKKAGPIVAEAKTRQIVATYGLPVDITPEQAILDEVHRAAGAVAWLEQKVRALSPEELIWGVTRVKEGGDDRGTTEEAVPHILLKLYQEERDRLVRVSTAAIKAGIEERRVKLAERDGSVLVQVIRAILGDLDLSAVQQAKVADIVPRHLRAVAA